MLPTKKVHLNFSDTEQLVNPNLKVEGKSDELDDFDSDQNTNAAPKKQRKRRTLSETSKRDFICGCGRSYVSYPAIYLHVQRKHNCEWPENTIIPEKPSTQDQVKRGRPKKEKNMIVDAEADLMIDDKSKVEDNFWLFIGTKGNPDNPKTENKFISNLETDSFNPLKVFIPQEIFENEALYGDLFQCMKTKLSMYQKSEDTEGLNRQPGLKTEPNATKNSKSYDQKLSHFLLWISTPMREDVFVEVSIIICLIRAAILSSVWFNSQENLINFKGDTLEIKMKPWTLLVKTTKADAEKTQSFTESKVCPLLGPKWSEIRKSSGGNILSRIISTVTNDKTCENSFMENIVALSDLDSNTLAKMTEAVLNLKETELKESAKAKRKFNFLNAGSSADLKDLIQRLCDWLQHFKEEDFNLQDTDLFLA